MHAVAELKNVGYAILRDCIDGAELLHRFEKNYLSKFTASTQRNRNLIKTFANDPLVRRAFLADRLMSFLDNLMRYPVSTGPIVTHWTAADATGGGFGLPFHQDWPSMGTSQNGLVCWMTLEDVSEDTHSIVVVPGSHAGGAMDGAQTESGYVLKNQQFKDEKILEVRSGDILVMSPWLAHKTYVNHACAPTVSKLSLSSRFDDLDDESWSDRDFVCAYQNVVNRDVWMT